VDTGYPLLLSEMTYATALRTAATSVVAARRLARSGSRVMALIGNGAQSEFQAIAFHAMLGIRELRVYDIDPKATSKLDRNLALLQLAGLRFVRCSSAAEDARGADIVTTVTADKRNAIILTPDMIRPGMHLNALGGDCPGKTELHADILRRPDARVFVEYEPQSRVEGEIQQLEPTFPVTELSAVLSGKAAARSSDTDVTIFDSVGFALEDFSTLRYLHRLHRAKTSERNSIDLVPDLADPKNLYAGIAARMVAADSARRVRESAVV
jgi:ornithine cyclodeaminase